MWRLPFYLIRIYQRAISPLLPATCRYTPTCSQYSADALRTYGLFKGIGLSLRRILRCHPWSAGGFDPVPQPPAPQGMTHPDSRHGDLRHG